MGWGPLIKTFSLIGVVDVAPRRVSARLGKNFTILDSDDARGIVKNILEAGGVRHKDI